MADVLIIAEAGVNHNGDIDLARRLVDEAAAAGADFVKFQTFRAEEIVTESAAKSSYQKTATGNDTQFSMLRELELDEAEHQAIFQRCREGGIGFLSTPFDGQSLEMLLELGMDRIKVPSGEITNAPFLRKVGAAGRDVIMSTGMARLEEVAAALALLEEAGTPAEHVVLLHCNTQYPTPLEDANLRAMTTLAETFPRCRVGFSDHTLGTLCALAAVARGATVIEKHFTLERTMPGPDHAASLEPSEFAELVRMVRDVETALGTGLKEPTGSERENIAVARRYLVAARRIAAGESFSEQNVAARRTGSGGLSPMLWDEVMGREAPRDFAVGEKVEL